MPMHLEQAEGLAHGGLNVQRLDVLPVLLQQRDEEVDSEHDVRSQLVLSHLDVTDGHTETQHLLELELDGRLDVVDLLLKVLGVRDRRRELAGLRETWTQETRNLLDQSVRRQESVVLLSKLLDKLLVLVELLQVLDGHVVKRNELSTVNVGSVGENAERHARARNVRQLNGTAETLVTLRVVVLETNLELDGLAEVALLVLRLLEQVTNGRSHT